MSRDPARRRGGADAPGADPGRDPRRPGRIGPGRLALLLLPLAGLLAMALYIAVTGWGIGEGAVVSRHGMIALALGIGLTLLLTAVLVGLLIFSHRRGYDDLHPPDAPWHRRDGEN